MAAVFKDFDAKGLQRASLLSEDCMVSDNSNLKERFVPSLRQDSNRNELKEP